MLACSQINSRVVRVPHTMSKSSEYASSFRMSRPTNVPSGSARIKTRLMLLAVPGEARNRILRGLSHNRAGVMAASSTVRSRELLSTTIISSTMPDRKKSPTAVRMCVPRCTRQHHA